MPWKEMSTVDLRLKFVLDARAGLFTFSELADQYGISRNVAYKWKRRYDHEGIDGLVDRPPVAAFIANRTPVHLEELVVALRRQHPTWGPKKLLITLERHHPDLILPARSTLAEILKRRGLVKARPRRPREGHPGPPQTHATSPNQIWAMDFKGQFHTRDGRFCYPFTTTDLFSRYLICCDGYLSTRADGVKASLERAFRLHGLPAAMRSDNGSPFASTGIARLSTLGVWLVKLGIRRELIQPGRPTQNAIHERMHKTLKQHTTRPPERNLALQQRYFDAFQAEFNHLRPHEALGLRPPAHLFSPSPRPFPDVLPEPQYPGHFEVRRVSRNGGVRWKKAWLNVGHSLIQENIGFEQIADGLWDAYFMNIRLGRFDEAAMTLVGTMATHYRCGKRGDRLATPSSGPENRDLLPSHSPTATPK